MKLVITESQLKKIVSSNILLEARSVTDLRGKNTDEYDKNMGGRSDNFYAFITKQGDMFILDSYKNEGRGRGEQNFISSTLSNHYDKLSKNIPDDVKSRYGEKEEVTHLDVVASIYVDAQKKTIKNVTSETTSLWVRDVGGRDQRYTMKVSEYYNPKMIQNMIKELLAKGHITSKFKYISPNVEDTTSGSTTEESNEGIFFYHGTTQTNAERIMKIGLRPQDTKLIGADAPKHLQSFFRDNSSTLPGYTDKNVYLSPSLDIAKVYAWRQSAEKVKDPERPYLKGDVPVVLKVKIPNPSLLMIDDDTALPELYRRFEKELEKHSTFIRRDKYKVGYHDRYNDIYTTDWTGDQEVKDFTTYAHDLMKQNLFSLVQTGEFRKFDKLESHGWGRRFDSKYYMEIKSQLGPSFYEWIRDVAMKLYHVIMNKYYKGSAHNSNAAVAYRGVIMPKFITEIPVEYKKKKY